MTAARQALWRRRVLVPVAAGVALSLTGLAAGVWAADTPAHLAAADTISAGDRAVFVPLTPARLLDTRASGQGPAVGAKQTRTLQVGGAGGVPTDATAVVLNVTVTGPTTSSFLTVYPAGGTKPGTSSLNFVKGQTIPNAVTVPLSSTGQVALFNAAGTVNVLVDVFGYYAPHDHDDRYLTKDQAQARTATNALSCPAGKYLQSVAADGSPSCATYLGSHVVPVPADSDATSNGLALRFALLGATSPSVVQLAPGSYDVGTQALAVPAGVSISGSGPSTSVTSGYAGGGSYSSAGAVVFAGASRVSNLSLTVTGPSGSTSILYAITESGTAALALDGVSITVTGGCQACAVIRVDTLTVDHSTLTVSPTGATVGNVLAVSSPTTVRDSTLSLTGVTGSGAAAVYVFGGATARIQGSDVTSSGYPLQTQGSSYARVTNSLVGSGSSGASGTITCLYSYSPAYVTLTNDCQT